MMLWAYKYKYENQMCENVNYAVDSNRLSL